MNNFINPVCLYKENDMDSFAGVWSVWKKYGDRIEYIPIKKDITEFKNYNDRDIICIKLEFDKENFDSLLFQANSVTLIDNSKISCYNIKHFDLLGVVCLNKPCSLLAWDYFHNTEPPLFMEYFQENEEILPHKDAVRAAIKSYKFKFEDYSELSQIYIDDLVIEGNAIIRNREIDITNIISHKRYIIINDRKIPIVNSSECYAEDCAKQISELDNNIGMSYYCLNKKLYITAYSKNTNLLTFFKDYDPYGNKELITFEIELEYDPIQNILDTKKVSAQADTNRGSN
jgi:hypothetical protein